MFIKVIPGTDPDLIDAVYMQIDSQVNLELPKLQPHLLNFVLTKMQKRLLSPCLSIHQIYTSTEERQLLES